MNYIYISPTYSYYYYYFYYYFCYYSLARPL